MTLRIMLPRLIIRNFWQLGSHSMPFSSKPSIYVTRPDMDPSTMESLCNSCQVSTCDKPLPVPRDELIRQISRKNALFCTIFEKIDKEVLVAAGSQLKCVATYSVGYEHIDVEECQKRGIRVGYTPGVLTDTTAELAVALLLAANRRLIEATKQVYNGGWKDWAPMWMYGKGLKCSQVGFFGFGRISQEIAARIFPFKPAEITYTTRTKRTKEAEAVNASHVEFDEMLSKSDIIVGCAALNPQTKEIFNTAAFQKMKSNCIFINIARGGIVDQMALLEALESRCIQAAGLDVTTPEPLPLDHPLLKLDNVVILPHIGSAEIETRKEMARITARNILAALLGEKMVAEVNV
uniref:Glyoxylate reductase/hydroxypyruvate reductase n=1 Tax=Drosophila rhopaloa TaxID=1041015 RepID=A0A6P4FBC6_DRORH